MKERRGCKGEDVKRRCKGKDLKADRDTKANENAKAREDAKTDEDTYLISPFHCRTGETLVALRRPRMPRKQVGRNMYLNCDEEA